MAKTKTVRRAEARASLLVATRKGLWTLVSDPARRQWKLAGPHFLGHIVHHALIDPRDPRHLYIGMSSGGVFESTDGGADWRPLNAGVKAVFLPGPDPEFGHDPHCVRLSPVAPDRLYQQNHCGIYRLDRPATRWIDIGTGMPKTVGAIGFPLVLRPRDPDTLWVFPMDGSSVWPRVSPGGRPAAYRSMNGGRTWRRQAAGMPEGQAWWTVRAARTASCSTSRPLPATTCPA